MRFAKTPRYEPLNWTPRKQALTASRPARELAKARAALPLLADQLPESAPVDLAAVALQRQTRLDAAEASMRALIAKHWRSARRRFFAATEGQQEAIRQAWAAWHGPLTALYYSYIVDLETGAYEARSKTAKARERAVRAAVVDQLNRQGVLQLGDAS